MSFETTTHELGDESWLVEVHGDLDFASAPRLQAALAAVDPEDARVAVDLADVPWLDSSGVCVLLRASRRLEQAGGGLAVMRPHPMARSYLELTGLDAVIGITDTLGEALSRATELTKRAVELCDDSRALRAEAEQARRRRRTIG